MSAKAQLSFEEILQSKLDQNSKTNGTTNSFDAIPKSSFERKLNQNQTKETTPVQESFSIFEGERPPAPQSIRHYRQNKRSSQSTQQAPDPKKEIHPLPLQQRPVEKPITLHRKFTPQEQAAFDFFSRHGEKLLPDLNESTLKRAYRTLALKLHPDHSRCSSLPFLELQRHHRNLLGFLKEARLKQAA